MFVSSIIYNRFGVIQKPNVANKQVKIPIDFELKLLEQKALANI